MSRRSLRQLEPPPDAARRSEADGGENLRLRRTEAGAGAGGGSDATAGMAASVGAVASYQMKAGLIFFFSDAELIWVRIVCAFFILIEISLWSFFQ
jgi:hypothetical protein